MPLNIQQEYSIVVIRTHTDKCIHDIPAGAFIILLSPINLKLHLLQQHFMQKPKINITVKRSCIIVERSYRDYENHLLSQNCFSLSYIIVCYRGSAVHYHRAQYIIVEQHYIDKNHHTSTYNGCILSQSIVYYRRAVLHYYRASCIIVERLYVIIEHHTLSQRGCTLSYALL